MYVDYCIQLKVQDHPANVTTLLTSASLASDHVVVSLLSMVAEGNTRFLASYKSMVVYSPLSSVFQVKKRGH